MKVVVTGSRGWADEELIRVALADLQAPVTIIEGDCRGADRLARKVATDLGYEVVTLPASWEVDDSTPPWAIRWYRGQPFDVRAGHERNREMLERDPDLVIAFHDELGPAGGQGGTRDCVDQALALGVPVLHVTHSDVIFHAGEPKALFS